MTKATVRVITYPQSGRVCKEIIVDHNILATDLQGAYFLDSRNTRYTWSWFEAQDIWEELNKIFGGVS